ncbi:MAG: hypothetical protein MJ145_02450 [Clostridia bacterium]|nr:hypothetical protein [Clostridia bacterium]
MKKTKKNVFLAILFSLTLIFSSSAGNTLAYLVDETHPMLNSFESGVDPYGSLELSNVVEHDYGESYIIPEDIKFNYEIDLGKEQAGKTYSGYKCDKDGIIHLQLGANESITLYEIPVGIDAKLTEVNIPEGFSVKGDNPKTCTIKKAEKAQAIFTNVYKASPADTKGLSLSGTKTLVGRDWLDSDSFKMILEEYDGDKWVELTSKNAVKDKKTFDFTELIQSISFDKVGTYMFRVREDEGSIGGITYEPTVGYFDIKITDADMDGQFEINDVSTVSEIVHIDIDHDKDSFDVSVDITNHYAPTGSAEIDININKVLVDKSGQDLLPAGYEFGLYDKDGKLVTTTVKSSSSGEAQIKLIYESTKVGVYKYILKEIDDSKPAVSYDDTEYKLTVNIVDNLDGTISAYVYDVDSEIVPSDATNKYTAKFKNTYDPTDTSVTVEGTVELEGRDINTGEFEFELYETDSDYDIEGKDPIQTVNNSPTLDAFNFKIDRDKVGTYYYLIKEKNNGIRGISYDSSEYFLKVVVVDAGGHLEASYTLKDQDGKDCDKAAFKNIYKAEANELIIEGKKILRGDELGDGQFYFELYESDEDFVEEELISDAPNDSEGLFSFYKLKFSKEGDYYYKVKEVIDENDKGIIYDTSVYEIKVSAVDDKTGILKLSQEIIKVKDGKSSIADEIRFTNTYLTGFARIDIKAHKDLIGRSLNKGEFNFSLFKSDESYREEDKVKAAKNDKKGNVVFKDLSFDEVGTYYFVMKENVGKDQKITYDTSKYGIKIEVFERDCKLKAKITSITKLGKGKVNGITFTNKYHSHGKKTPKTGDTTNVLLWLEIMIVSLLGLLLALWWYYRSSKKSTN